MGTSSADPDRLRDYGDGTAEGRDDLARHATDLQQLIDAFNGAEKELGHSIPGLGEQLRALVGRLAELDHFVEDVGRAFADVDQRAATFMAGRGYPPYVTARDEVLDSHLAIWQAVRDAGLAEAFEDRAAARQAAERLADAVLDQLEAGQFREGTLAQLERNVQHPWFATALMDHMGPVGLTSVAAALDVRLANWQVYHGPAGIDGPHPFEYREAGERLLDILAHGLTVASHDPDWDARRFADGLVSAAIDEHGAVIGLSILLYRGGEFHPTFAWRVADGIYRAERELGPAPVWRPRAEGYDGAFFEQHHWFDPMVSVAQMLSRDATLAQRFLLAADRAAPRGNRLSYLTGQRTWQADEGNAFGNLIVAAATTYRDFDGPGSPGYQSAQIASQFLDELPYGSGGRPFGSDDFRIYKEMRDSVGIVLATYMFDVQRAVNPPYDDVHAGRVSTIQHPQLPQHLLAHGILLDSSRIKALLRAVLSDPVAAEHLLAAQGLLASAQLDDIAARVADTDPAEHARLVEHYRTALQNNGRLAAAIADAMNLNDIAAAAGKDARAQALVGMLNSGAGTVPVPGGPLTKLAVDQLRRDLFGFASTDFEGQARHRANTAINALETSLQELAVSTLLVNGWYATGGPYEGGHPFEVVAELADPDLPVFDTYNFLGPDGHLRPTVALTQEQWEAYEAWVSGRGLPPNLRLDVGAELKRGIDDY